MAENFTVEEIFAACLEAMHHEVNGLEELVDQTEQCLGSAHADRPSGDHTALLNAVLTRRAERDAARRLFQIALGYKTGAYIPKTKESKA